MKLVSEVLFLAVCVSANLQFQLKSCGQEASFVLRGELNLALLVRECNSSEIVHTRSLVTSAIWTTERLNFMEYTAPLRLGLSVYKVCKESDYYNAVFKAFVKQEDTVLLGVISDKKFSRKLEEFGGVLGVDHEVTTKYWNYLVKASVRLLGALELQENVTVVASREDVLMEFFRQSRKEWVCVRHCILMK